jgi:RimJ/RimL family protein N-acetyltransferase
VGVHRLEARAAVKNGRGNGALRKMGAVQEGVLRRSFLKNGEYHDQVLWSILDEDWAGAQRTDIRFSGMIH